MTKKSYIFVSLFIAILLLSLMLGCSFMINANKKANAEYIDILNDTSALVNFNQLVPNDKITTTIPSSSQVQVVTTNLSAGNSYYIRFSTSGYSGGDYSIGYHYGSTNTALQRFYDNTTYDNIFVLPVDASYIYLYGDYSFNVQNLNIFNLTQMFGSDSIPSLQDCRNLFTADYYNYDTGSAVSFSTLNSYNQAVQNVLANYQYSLDRNALNTTTYYYDLTGNPDGNYAYNGTSWYIYGAVAVPLFTTLNAGANLIITYQFYSPNLPDGYWDICFASLTTNDERLELGSQPYNGSLNVFQINLPVNVSTILIYARNPDNQTITDLNCLVGQLDVKATQLDIAGMIASAYSSGYDNATRVYEDYYSSGASGYSAIYQSGYVAGVNANYEEALGHIYTFNEFIGALFDVPVKTLISLLDFNVFGFNMKNFVFSLITLSIVFAIIKLILVKAGDK